MTITLSNTFIISEIERLIDKRFNVKSKKTEGNTTSFFTSEGLKMLKVTIFSNRTNDIRRIHISSDQISSEDLYAMAEKIDNKYGKLINIDL